MKPTNTHALAAAIAAFEKALPDWWWSVGACSVSRDVSCGPDRNGRDKALLDIKRFDEGFHIDHEGTLEDAIQLVTAQAVSVRTQAMLKASEGGE